MAWTQQDLENLQRNMASGILVLRTSDGRRAEYRSITEMERVEARMIKQLNATTRKARQRRVYTNPRRGH